MTYIRMQLVLFYSICTISTIIIITKTNSKQCTVLTVLINIQNMMIYKEKEKSIFI